MLSGLSLGGVDRLTRWIPCQSSQLLRHFGDSQWVTPMLSCTGSQPSYDLSSFPAFAFSMKPWNLVRGY